MTAGRRAVLAEMRSCRAGVVAASRVRAGQESDRVSGRSWIDSAAARAEHRSAGLPVGVQVVAPHWREDVVLRVMTVLEEHFREQPEYPSNPPIQKPVTQAFTCRQSRAVPAEE
jgi:fatty acid amide hydrolase